MNSTTVIIYDFDGTILDTLPWHLRAYRQAVEKLGAQLSDQQIIKKCFNIIDKVAAKNCGLDDATAFSKYYHQGAREGFKKATLHNNIVATLSKLNKLNYTVCLGSLARQHEFDPALEKFHLKQYFKYIMSFDDCPHEKPIIFKKLAQQATRDLPHVAVIGDAYNDIEAAKYIGARSITYHPSEHEKFYSEESLRAKNPDYIIKDHLELFNILK